MTSSATNFTQIQELLESPEESDLGFGYSVATDNTGARVAIGTPFDSRSVTKGGSVFVYRFVSGTTWTLEARLEPSTPAANMNFGNSVSFDDGADRIAVGAPGASTSAGAVYVFSRASTTWTQEQVITPTVATAGDQFGVSVSLDDGADTLVIGAPYEDTTASDSGAAYIFTRAVTTWSQVHLIKGTFGGDVTPATGDLFGWSVSISYDASYLLVGAPGQEFRATNGGSVYVVDLSGPSNVVLITPADIEANDLFGYSVCMSSDDSTSCVIGSPYRTVSGTANAGRVFVVKNFVDMVTATFTEVTAATPVENGLFGYSVSDSQVDAYFAVGAPTLIGTGQVYAYNWSGAAWVENVLTATGASTGDRWGVAVALSKDGSGGSLKLASGLLNYSVHPDATEGAVAINLWSGGSETDWAFSTLIKAPVLPFHNYGCSVACDQNGDRIAVGVYSRAYRVDPDAVYDAAGAVFVYLVNGSTWELEQLIQADSPAANDNLGYDLNMSSDGALLAASAPGYGTGGGIFIFTRSGTTWTQSEIIEAATPVASAGLGNSIDLTPDGTRLIAGTQTASDAPIYTFEKTGGTFGTEDTKLDSNVLTHTAAGSEYFGYSVAIASDQSYIVAGMPNDSTIDTNYGSVFLFINSHSVPKWNAVAWIRNGTYLGAYYGTSVCSVPSSDATQFVAQFVVGAPNYNTNTGAIEIVRVFTASPYVSRSFVEAVTAQTSQYFGQCVRSSNDGNLIFVSAYNANADMVVASGKVVVFQKDGSSYTYVTDIIRDPSIAGDQLSRLVTGKTIAASEDGTVTLIGAPESSDNGTHAGAAFLFAGDIEPFVTEAENVVTYLVSELTTDRGVDLTTGNRDVYFDNLTIASLQNRAFGWIERDIGRRLRMEYLYGDQGLLDHNQSQRNGHTVRDGWYRYGPFSINRQ